MTDTDCPLLLIFLIKMICAGVERYTALSHKRLRETGYYEQNLSSVTSDQVGVSSSHENDSFISSSYKFIAEL